MHRSHKARVHSFTSIITNTIRRCHHASSCVYALLKLSYVSLLTLVFRFHYGTNDHEPLAGLSLRNPRLGASAPQDPKNWKIQGCNFATNSFCKKCIWRCLGGARGGDPSRGPKSEHNFRIRASALQDRKNIGKFKYDFELRLVHTIDYTCARYMSTIA